MAERDWADEAAESLRRELHLHDYHHGVRVADRIAAALRDAHARGLREGAAQERQRAAAVCERLMETWKAASYEPDQIDTQWWPRLAEGARLCRDDILRGGAEGEPVRTYEDGVDFGLKKGLAEGSQAERDKLMAVLRPLMEKATTPGAGCVRRDDLKTIEAMSGWDAALWFILRHVTGWEPGFPPYGTEALKALDRQLHRKAELLRELTPEEAEAAYDAAEPEPLSPEHIEEMVKYATGQPAPDNSRWSCKHCGGVPDEYGYLEHNRGCPTNTYTGCEFVEEASRQKPAEPEGVNFRPKHWDDRVLAEMEPWPTEPAQPHGPPSAEPAGGRCGGCTMWVGNIDMGYVGVCRVACVADINPRTGTANLRRTHTDHPCDIGEYRPRKSD